MTELSSSSSTADPISDDEFDVEVNVSPDLNATLERLREFSYYLVEHVELNLNLCLGLLEERDTPSKQNSIYGTVFSKLLSTIPKVGAALGNVMAKGEIVIFDKIDKRNSRILADLVYYFSDHKEDMRNTLIQASLDLFLSFESQFMRLSCKGGPKRVMQKLAKDASDRIFNYFLETEQKKDVTRTEVAKGVLFGDSKRNRKGIKEGKTVMDGEVKWKTCKLYRKAGIVIVEDRSFFKNETTKTEKYGHRRLFPWENPEDIRANWEKEPGLELPNYTLSVRDEFVKPVRDYIMTKNVNDEAKLERENYNKEAMEDRKMKYDELKKVFQEHFQELLEELGQQYGIIVDNHRENKELVMEISKNQEDEKLFHREIHTKLEEIQKDIGETKVLIERRETVVRGESSCGSSALTVEQVKVLVREESNRDVEEQIVELVREKLRKNDPGPRIHNELTRNLKKLKW